MGEAVLLVFLGVFLLIVGQLVLALVVYAINHLLKTINGMATKQDLCSLANEVPRNVQLEQLVKSINARFHDNEEAIMGLGNKFDSAMRSAEEAEDRLSGKKVDKGSKVC